MEPSCWGGGCCPWSLLCGDDDGDFSGDRIAAGGVDLNLEPRLVIEVLGAGGNDSGLDRAVAALRGKLRRARDPLILSAARS